MPPSTRTKQQLLVSTEAACGCCWWIYAGLSPEWHPWSPCSTTVRPPSPSPLPTITKIKCWMHLLLSHHYKLPLISSSNHHMNTLWKIEIIHFLCHFLMHLCGFSSCLLLTNFHLATIAESSNRNISAPGNISTGQSFWPLWPKHQEALWKKVRLSIFLCSYAIFHLATYAVSCCCHVQICQQEYLSIQARYWSANVPTSLIT